jgi:hypothetical protein
VGEALTRMIDRIEFLEARVNHLQSRLRARSAIARPDEVSKFLAPHAEQDVAEAKTRERAG